MRTATAGELTVLAGLTRRIEWRVKIANGSGTMIDLSTWLVQVTPDQDIDQPVAGATVSFARANGVLQTLSPLRTDSTLNIKDDLTFAPLVDLVRSITIELATTASGVLPLSGDFKLLFKGTTSVVAFASNPISVTCRDQGAVLVDRFIEAATLYGSGAGIAVQTVMQSIHDDVLGGGVVPVYTPVSPGYLISPAYRPQFKSIMDADVELAQGPGWDVRYRWDDGTSAFRFTFKEPGRAKVIPDYTFGPSSYFDVTKLELEETDIRNVVILSYRDSADAGHRKVITRSDSPSIAKYGRKPLIIIEGDDSPIDTSAEATTMADAALADLKDPKADMEITMPVFWPMDLGDLYRFSANGVHFNTDQDLSVVSFTHENHETRVRVRGTPAGQYLTWLDRGGQIGTAFPPRAMIYPNDGDSTDLSVNMTFDAVQGSGGGGTNLTYAVYQKIGFAATSTIYSGDESTLPRTVSILRHPRSAKNLRYVVTDAVTGLSDEMSWSIPPQRLEINDAGDTLTSAVKGHAGFSIRNGSGSTAFGANRHNDEQAAINGDAKTFGVSFDTVPQMRALPQSFTVPGASSTVDRTFEFKATGVSVAGYTVRAVYITGATAAAKTENPATTLNGTPVASVAITTNNGVAFWNLSQANATLTNYRVHFDLDTTSLDPVNQLTVSLYRNNGTGSTTWTLMDSGIYAPGQSLTDQQLAFDFAMDLNYDLRILCTLETGHTGDPFTVTAKACTYDKITAGSENTITGGAGNSVVFQAMEAP